MPLAYLGTRKEAGLWGEDGGKVGKATRARAWRASQTMVGTGFYS